MFHLASQTEGQIQAARQVSFSHLLYLPPPWAPMPSIHQLSPASMAIKSNLLLCTPLSSTTNTNKTSCWSLKASSHLVRSTCFSSSSLASPSHQAAGLQNPAHVTTLGPTGPTASTQQLIKIHIPDPDVCCQCTSCPIKRKTSQFVYI